VTDREPGEGEQVVGGSRSICSTFGNCSPSIVAMTSNCSRTCSASGWAKMVRIAAATISWVPLGTTAKALRMKCTRHRCHSAPISTERIACFSPVWALEMTSWTPASPRAFRPRRNAVQNAPSSESPTSNPRTSLRPSAVTPVAITTAWDTTLRLTRALQ
jgi:hypothetical protein